MIPPLPVRAVPLLIPLMTPARTVKSLYAPRLIVIETSTPFVTVSFTLLLERSASKAVVVLLLFLNFHALFHLRVQSKFDYSDALTIGGVPPAVGSNTFASARMYPE